MQLVFIVVTMLDQLWKKYSKMQLNSSLFQGRLPVKWLAIEALYTVGQTVPLLSSSKMAGNRGTV